MGSTTRIYDKWQGYSVLDCDCRYCMYYRGKARGCSRQVCCCSEERTGALSRENSSNSVSISAELCPA